MRHKTIRAFAWSLAVLMLFGLSCGDMTTAATAQERAELAKEIEALNQQSAAFTELFSKTIELVLPSVVSVSTTRTETVAVTPFNPEDFFRLPDPFGFRGQPAPEQPRQREFKRSGLGSGFVVDAKQGYIVTNSHVVEGVEAKDIKVTFSDGREVTAQKVFKDPKTEAAVIKIEPDGLEALEWGKSDEIRIGQWVMAIGSPMGLGNTVTTGIISATSTRERVFGRGGSGRSDLRIIQNPYAIEDYIQTDAAINPGNSGGPLVTLTGKVIGINTLIVSSTGGSVGLGFAVPERIARPVAEDLIASGRVIRGHLGVSILDPAQISEMREEDLLEVFGMRNAEDVLNKFKIGKDAKGVLIADLLRGGPADKAKIEQGDLILSVAKTETPDTGALRDLVAAMKPGTKVEVTLMRKGRKEKVTAEIGEQPSDERAWAKGAAKLGVWVQTLTPDISRALGYPQDMEGVIIANVAADSPAARAGLQRNDVILDVGRTAVKNEEEFNRAIADLGEDGVVLRVRRGDDIRFVTVKP